MIEVQTGRAGELMACGIIEAMGYRTVLCQQRNFDAMIWVDDKFYRVEIKTATAPRVHKNGRRYEFGTATGSRKKVPIDPKQTDILCLLALDIRRCYFVAAYKQTTTRANILPAKMVGYSEAEQLAVAIALVDERRL